MSQRYQAAILSASFNGLKAPDAPTIGTATAGSGSASVAFTAPANVGGGAITGYTVISSPGSILGTGASSPVTVSGLTNGTAYTFTVVATNSYGTGPASAASNSVTPAVNYIENVFSTWLYTGNGTTQTITNGIDLSANGGLVWGKSRSAVNDHFLINTVRGAANSLSSNLTDGNSYDPDRLTAFTTSGFSVGTSGSLNTNGTTYASWTFRKQPKFFDVVTYTGNGTNNRAINHNLGSIPGCVIVKNISQTGQWWVYHQSLGLADQLQLQSTNAVSAGYYEFGTNAFTTTQFGVSSDGGVNRSGDNYVAYLFAHDAGGFGLTGTDNVISCGSFTTSSGGGDATVNLGYEPQWLLVKSSSGISGWDLMDNMRGMPNYGTYGSATALEANNSNAEGSRNPNCYPTATGFYYARAASTTYIYIAIRRGPMAVPTSGTSVFTPVAYTGDGTTRLYSVGFPTDLSISKNRAVDNTSIRWTDRLKGNGAWLASTSTGSESAQGTDGACFDNQTNIILATDRISSGVTYVNYSMRRAPSFFDEVCYTGNGGTQTITHNLGVAPELIIGRNRTGSNWSVNFNFASTTQSYAFLNLTDSGGNTTYAGAGVFSTAPTSTSIFLTASGSMNGSGQGIVAYLFASCPGVSKVGIYTGTGALQTINCAFTTGARWVMIKRTDSTGDWYVWDSARGITAGNDPYLLINSTAAEVTGTNYVDSTAAGFQVTAAAPAGLNAVGGTYIFLAIA